jgi:hypothetical protein
MADEQTDHGRRVDTAHEALISGWPQLQEWLSERRDAEKTRRLLEDKAAEWVRLGRGRGGLLDEAELAEATRWLASSDATELGYGEDLSALVAASRIEQARELRQLRTRFVGAVAFAAVALLAALGAYVFFQQAADQRERAETERDPAETEAAQSTAEANAGSQARIAATSEAQAVAARATAEWQSNVSRVTALTAQAPLQHEVGENERGALLARQAYLFDQAEGGAGAGSSGQRLAHHIESK